jgi:hypothetical protein
LTFFDFFSLSLPLSQLIGILLKSISTFAATQLVSAFDANRATPLHYAAWLCEKKAIEILTSTDGLTSPLTAVDINDLSPLNYSEKRTSLSSTDITSLLKPKQSAGSLISISRPPLPPPVPSRTPLPAPLTENHSMNIRTIPPPAILRLSTSPALPLRPSPRYSSDPPLPAPLSPSRIPPPISSSPLPIRLPQPTQTQTPPVVPQRSPVMPSMKLSSPIPSTFSCPAQPPISLPTPPSSSQPKFRSRVGPQRTCDPISCQDIDGKPYIPHRSMSTHDLTQNPKPHLSNTRPLFRTTASGKSSSWVIGQGFTLADTPSDKEKISQLFNAIQNHQLQKVIEILDFNSSYLKLYVFFSFLFLFYFIILFYYFIILFYYYFYMILLFFKNLLLF